MKIECILVITESNYNRVFTVLQEELARQAISNRIQLCLTDIS